jgi:hypothetical protein
MVILDNRGRSVPFFVNDFTYEDIRTTDFDPITTLHDADNVHPTEMNDSTKGKYSRNGFLIRPDTDGAIWVITHEQYVRNHKSFTGLVPRKFLGLANTWIECPVVRVHCKAVGTYAAASDYINVACI